MCSYVPVKEMNVIDVSAGMGEGGDGAVLEPAYRKVTDPQLFFLFFH